MTDQSAACAAMTGAGGSLGQALSRHLLARGVRVRGLVRSAGDADALTKLGGHSVQGDVRDSKSLAQLVEGAEVVFHLAAWLGQPFKERLAYAVNVEGTRRVVEAAAQAGCRRVVHASSVAVYGPVQEGAISEMSPTWSVGDLYGDTKIAAEEAAREAAARMGVELVIFRPTMIYGPASPSWTTTPFDAIRRGLPLVIGDGNSLADAIYIGDVARAFDLAGFTPQAAGETFNVGAGPVTWNDFLGHYARMVGVPLRRLPVAVARGGAGVGAGLSRTIGQRPRLPPEMVGVMTSRATFPTDKAKRILGFTVETSLDEGMRRTEAWLRRTGRLKRPDVALVTGAASGLGSAVVKRLQEEGLEVVAADLNLEALTPLQRDGVHTLRMDVTSDASVREAVTSLKTVRGAVTLLVNVAGINRPAPLETQPEHDLMAQFEVNTFGPVRLARALLPAMRAKGGGRIVNVSSTNGFLVTPFMGAYSASKYALEALSDSLRLELAPFGIDVVVVQPGAMKTPFAARAKAVLRDTIADADDYRPYLQSFLDSTLWGEATATLPEKVAQTVVYAALANRPRARVYGTLDALPTRLFALMPDALKDRFFRQAAGLTPRAQP